jgi:hypothetical protein
MAGQVISDPGLLASLRARLYRFDLQLVRQENWLLKQAGWQPAGLDELK